MMLVAARLFFKLLMRSMVSHQFEPFMRFFVFHFFFFHQMDKLNALVLWNTLYVKKATNGQIINVELVPATEQLYQVHKNSFAKRKENDKNETESKRKRKSTIEKDGKRAKI